MELTEQVKISLDSAEHHLREALSFASKTEEANINIWISQIISAVDKVKNHYKKSNDPMEDALRRFFS